MKQLTEFEKFTRGIVVLERYSADADITIGQSIPRISVLLHGISELRQMEPSDISFLHFLGWKYERNAATPKGEAVMFGFYLKQPAPKSMGSIEGLMG